MLRSLTLFVRDLERSKEFYSALDLEFHPFMKDRDGPIEGYGAQVANMYHMWIYLRVGEPGQGELTFSVQSGGDVRDRLRRRGFPPAPGHSPANPRGPFAYLDPDGRLVSFDEIG